MAWAANIGDADLRQRTLQNCFATWLSNDVFQASRWLEQATVDVATRQILQAAVESSARQQQQRGLSIRADGNVIVVY